MEAHADLELHCIHMACNGLHPIVYISVAFVSVKSFKLHSLLISQIYPSLLIFYSIELIEVTFPMQTAYNQKQPASNSQVV